MRKLSFEEIKRILFGGVEFEEKDGALSAHRFTEKQRAIWKAIGDFVGGGALCTAGIRLDFHTDADHITFRVSGKDLRSLHDDTYKFEVLIDGLFHSSTLCVHQNTIEAALPAGGHRVTLVFPSHIRGYLHEMLISEGATLTPHPYGKKILLTGDSITQGWNSRLDCRSYAWRIALALNADLLNHGVGGSCFHKTVYKELSFEPELITVAYGCNDYSHTESEEALRTNIADFFSALKERYPDTRTVGILPIPRLSEPSDKPLKTFANCRRIIREEYAVRGIEIIDGFDLMPANEALYADHLHPNADGFAVYAENLIPYLK